MIGQVDWASLQAFLILAREERLTVAARKAGLDHSTLKRRITSLEQALGTILFERKPTGYVLTIAGHEALRAAEEMESASLKLSDAKLNQAVHGTVRISAADILGQTFLSPRLGTLASKYPELELQLVTTPRPSDLTKREADIAIAMSRPERGRLHSRKLADFELGLYSTQSYLDNSPRLMDIGDLQNHKLIGYISDLVYRSQMNYLPNIDPKLRMSFAATNALCQLEAVRADAGLAVLPCWLVDSDPWLVRVLPGQIVIFSGFWLAVNSDMREIAAVRLVSEFIAEEITKAHVDFTPSRAPGSS